VSEERPAKKQKVAASATEDKPKLDLSKVKAKVQTHNPKVSSSAKKENTESKLSRTHSLTTPGKVSTAPPPLRRLPSAPSISNSNSSSSIITPLKAHNPSAPSSAARPHTVDSKRVSALGSHIKAPISASRPSRV
jgi:hypothetical protein